MSDVEKRRAALVACCLNNLYGLYGSLQTFCSAASAGRTLKFFPRSG